MGATTPHSYSVWFGLVSCGLVWLVWFGREGYNHTEEEYCHNPNSTPTSNNITYLTPVGFDNNIGLHTHISHAAPPYKPCCATETLN